MALRLQLKVASPAGDLYGIKDVTLTRALPEGQPVNSNPVLTGLLFDGAALNLTVMSYLDHVDFGFMVCRELVPDVVPRMERAGYSSTG